MSLTFAEVVRGRRARIVLEASLRLHSNQSCRQASGMQVAHPGMQNADNDQNMLNN
jgi:hypothetical protein